MLGEVNFSKSLVILKMWPPIIVLNDSLYGGDCISSSLLRFSLLLPSLKTWFLAKIYLATCRYPIYCQIKIYFMSIPIMFVSVCEVGRMY